MPYDCQNRDWGYRLTLGKVEHLGEPLARQREQLTSKHLNEAIISGVILGAADGLDQLFEMYPDGMPPGFMTRADKLAEQDRLFSAPKI
ncbi:hypothetical protein [Salipiger mucosus]|uniref:Uncharacterized protein n=1 Tax=Salipiger mucosus DSM 16094 TaxID=1123237 RepID=S9QDX9_9RHOB|nr:hypothetical protein [Salipiger mucosus]EPX78092.1 hypothetical protein Salmuc_03420 [Salipiger mucosus DSM 16094]